MDTEKQFHSFGVRQKDLSKDDLVTYLKLECRRVKIQRNQYEQKLMLANRRINKLEAENKGMENFINKTK